MVKPNILYGDLKDKYVAGVIAYAHTDNFLYYDADHTTGNTMNAEEMKDYFTKGLLRIVSTDGTGVSIPTDMTMTVSGSTLTVKLADGTTAYTSKERTEE